MPFQTMGAAEYRSLDAAAFEERRNAVISELENADSQVSTADLNTEVGIIEQEVQRRNAAVNLRNANIAAVANGAGALVGAPVASTPDVRVTRSEDPFDTEDYNRAFMNFVVRGEQMPSNLVTPGMRPENVRADAFTYTTDVANFIPTTLSNTIIEKMSTYGEIWPLVTKMNVQGGLDINIWDFLPTASWITESTTADYQKAPNPTRISFKYYMLEARLAQSFLTQLTTLEAFQRRFPEKAAEAMVRALEQAIIRGNGTGQPLGILNEARIQPDHKLSKTADDISTWAGWSNILKPLTRRYRNGYFVMAQDTWDRYINGMVDTTGQPVTRVNYGLDGANNEQLYFMGKRVMIVEDDILPAFDDATNDEAFMLFTRFSDYLVNQQEGMRAIRWNDEEANLVKDKIQTVVDGKMGDINGTLIFKKSDA